MIDGPASRVFDEAENRLHTTLAVFLHALGARADAAHDDQRSRTRRRSVCIELLSDGLEATQEEIVERARRRGLHGDAGDDLARPRRRRCGAPHDNGRTVYALPERNGPPDGFGKRVFAELVRDVASSGNLVVVRTFPGMAPTVAAVLDQSDVDGVLGTVAGDDTVLVVADEKSGGKRVAEIDLGTRERREQELRPRVLRRSRHLGLRCVAAGRARLRRHRGHRRRRSGPRAGRLQVRADAAGVSDLVVLDLREEFVTDFCWPALKANALYEGRYPLVSALSRPLIAKHLVRVARERGATAVAHGCTGKGNDQVRFETSIAALAPELEIHAPIRETGMQRDQAIAYAKEHGIPVTVTADKPFSIDENLWGRAIESGRPRGPVGRAAGEGRLRDDRAGRRAARRAGRRRHRLRARDPGRPSTEGSSRRSTSSPRCRCSRDGTASDGST